MADESENQLTGAEDGRAAAAAAQEAAKAAATRGEPTEADLQVERDQKLDEARGKAADAAKAAAKQAKEDPAKVEKVEDAEAPLYAEASEEDKAWAKEAYGDQVAGVMEKAGINAAAANAYWQEHGKLPDAAFAKLEEVGYPRAMVNAYLSGVEASQKAADEEGEAFAAEVTKIAGSGQNWSRMTEWATQNFSKAEIADFNAVIDSKNVGAMRIAAGALKARYEQANGKLPKTALTGEAASAAAKGKDVEEQPEGDVFKSTAEIVTAQRDPRYQTDPAYRREVEQKVVRSNRFGKARR